MSLQLKIAFVIYWLNAIIMLIIGCAFVFSPTFFPFHGDVIQTSWNDLTPPFKTLYLGMMRTEGAGYLASATAIIFLLIFPFRRQETWSVWAITVIGVVEHLPTFLANVHVAQTTPANPPWLFVGSCMVSLLIGFLLVMYRDVLKKTDKE